MQNTDRCSRRVAVTSSVFGLITAGFPAVTFADEIRGTPAQPVPPQKLPDRYPAIDDALVSELVGSSHFDLDRVRTLVDERPELARATWDWGFGDWESAIGAASHVGRRDIVEYLLSRGARPDIFTCAMLGRFESVKAQVQSIPGAEHIPGPHGISLLQHARNGLRSDTADSSNADEHRELIAWLETRNIQGETVTEELSESQKAAYLGDYKYGPGPNDGFSVRLNMRKLPTLGRIGTFGGALYPSGRHAFRYNGCPSVRITFQVDGDQVRSLTVEEPGLTMTARKV